jgi:hypothetical protein
MMTDLATGAPPHVANVAAMWDKGVVVGVDPTKNGAPMYGVCGHVYLFASGLTSNLTADGDMVVEMWGIVPDHADNKPECLQIWRLKKDDLNREYHNSGGRFGEGYTLKLPWPGYRPDISQAQMRLRYEPAKGMALYHLGVVILNSGPEGSASYSHHMETGNHQPIAGGLQPNPGQPTAVAQQQPPMPPVQQQAPTPVQVQPAANFQQQAPMPPPGNFQQQVPMPPPAPPPGSFQQPGAVPVPAMGGMPQQPVPAQQPWAVPPSAMPPMSQAVEVPPHPVPPPQPPRVQYPMNTLPQYADPPQMAPSSFPGAMPH